jgi:hypothetical protein
VLHQHPQILDRRNLDHPVAHVRQDLGDPFPGDTPLAAYLRPVLAVLSHERLDSGRDDSKARVVVVLDDRLGCVSIGTSATGFHILEAAIVLRLAVLEREIAPRN